MNHTTSYLLVRGLVRFALGATVLVGLLMLIGFIEGMSF
jgi:hypothetical protein